MPNAAPPTPAAARRRAAAPPPSTPTSSAPAAPLCVSSASPSPAGLPASFAGFGALLADAGERVPADAMP